MSKIEKLKKQIDKATGKEKISLRLELAYLTRLNAPKLSSYEAMTAWEEARKIENHELELRAIYLICTAALYNKEFSAREEWLEKLETRGRELHNNPSIGRANILRSRWFAREGNNIAAAEYLIKALDFFDEEKNISDLASCYNGLGNIYHELSDYDKALEYYKKAMPFARIMSKNVHNMVKQNIALILTKKNQFAAAWKIFDNILDSLSKDELDTKRVIYLNLGHICQKTGELEEALEYFEDAIELSRSSLPSHYLIRPICNKALIMSELGNFEESLKVIKEAEDLSEESDNLYDLLEVYYRYSDIYENWEKPKEQVGYLKKIIKLERQMHEKSGKKEIRAFQAESK